MGHILKDNGESYFEPQRVEENRKFYDYAMPDLAIKKTEDMELRKAYQTMDEIRRRLSEYETTFGAVEQWKKVEEATGGGQYQKPCTT